MRLRNIPGAAEAVAAHHACVTADETLAGRWQELFGNSRPIRMEIGMGKGRFLMTLAEQNPSVNYIGVERYCSVLYRAIQKYDENPLPNLRFLCIDAAAVDTLFAPGEIDRIYLNFSDPWPKDRHAKRRLTSQAFLSRYDRILKPEGTIEFKTDNQDLFSWSLEQLSPAGWQLDAATRDLHHDPVLNKGNIMTEYEQKFSAAGNPICKMIISR
jgi:tRNA (guanine-N7-)-methyltransferase